MSKRSIGAVSPESARDSSDYSQRDEVNGGSSGAASSSQKQARTAAPASAAEPPKRRTTTCAACRKQKVTDLAALSKYNRNVLPC